MLFLALLVFYYAEPCLFIMVWFGVEPLVRREDPGITQGSGGPGITQGGKEGGGGVIAKHVCVPSGSVSFTFKSSRIW